MNKIRYMILGTSRGGTTILAAALGAHPLVAVLDEDMTGAFDRITGGKIPGIKLCVPNQIELDKRWNPIFRIGLTGGYFRKSLFMNKIPKSSLNIRDYGNFGDIKHICILRHPAGVIPSIINREHRSEKVAIYRWQRTIEVFNELNSDRTFAPVYISFEKLITNPEDTLQKLCANLGIPYSSQMLEAPSRNARYTGSNFDSRKGIYINKEEIWRKIPQDTRRLYEKLIDIAV